jgi:hypothetical protein
MAENNQTKSKGRGGARAGAGRKPGSANVKTREIADRAAKEGKTPLEIMVEAMREAYMVGGAVAAFAFAKDAAPYMHAKLSSTDLKATVEHRTLDQAIQELDAALAAGAPH